MLNRSLALYEEILLLALDDGEGTTSQAGFYTNAMGGAILAELALRGSIAIADDKKKKVTPGRHGRLDDPILDECLTLITAAKKTKNASEWVMKFSNLKDLKHRVARQLVTKGVLAEETDTVLMVFNLVPIPPTDGGRVATSLLPPRLAHAVSRIEPYGMFILVGLMVTGILCQLIGPVIDSVIFLIQTLTGLR